MPEERELHTPEADAVLEQLRRGRVIHKEHRANLEYHRIGFRRSEGAFYHEVTSAAPDGWLPSP